MKSSDPNLVRLIALVKLIKALLLIAVGVAALKLIHSDVATFLEDAISRLGLDPGGRHVGHLILEAATLTPNRIKDLGVGSFIYAALFLTEGLGLWFVKRWAEWLTVIITGSLIPVEIYEIFRHPTPSRFLLLAINLLVVGFLIYRIRGERSGFAK